MAIQRASLYRLHTPPRPPPALLSLADFPAQPTPVPKAHALPLGFPPLVVNTNTVLLMR